MNRIISFIFFLSTLLSSSFAQEYNLVWSDEFDGEKLNLNNWSYEYGNGVYGWGTGQVDFCTDREKNVKVSDGTLKLTLQYEDYNGFEHTSGRINTHRKVSFKYGKLEVRVRVPAGKGIGAAFWMLPEETHLGGWPKSGEIDIVETNGDQLETNYGTVHYEQWGGHQHTGSHVPIPGDISKDFHTYWIEWDENSIRWFVDGKQYHEFSIKEPIDGRRVFHDPFYIILSTGVGSQFSGKVIDDHLLPQSMEFDYIRVYQKVKAPQPVYAKTNGKGTEVELTFSGSMKNPEAADTGMFSLTSSKGRALKLNGISIQYRDNTTYILKLENPVQKEENIYLTYTGDKISGDENQKIESFEKFPVANIMAGANPFLYSGETRSYYDVSLRFSKVLRLPDTLDINNFSISVNGNSNKILKITPVEYNSGMILSLESPIVTQADKIMISYKGTALTSNDGTALLPFENLQIKNTIKPLFILPCKIEAEDYMEAEGVRTQKTDDEGGGKNIGYIDDHEWLKYSIYVPEGGNYFFTFRISSEAGGGIIEIQNQDEKIVRTEVPSTKSWQTWATVRSETVQLKKGIASIKLLAYRGGFNVNWLSIERE